MPRADQLGDRELILGRAFLVALVEVPTGLARETMARQRRLGGVLELDVTITAATGTGCPRRTSS